MHPLLHWLAYMTGSLNTPGAPPNYNFWSGFGGDIAIIGALLWAPVVLLRKHNCHAARCWRIGRHKVPGTEFTCCARHTPGGAPAHAHILALHAARPAAAGSAEAGERLYDQEKDTP